MLRNALSSLAVPVVFFFSLFIGGMGHALAACDPENNGDHSDCITEYTGPEVCVSCHLEDALEMHGSVHYQQHGETDFVTNIDGLAGERAFDIGETGINTYCGTHENSPRFTCSGCHVGNGRFPMLQQEFAELDPESPEAQAQLANIDCMICHQDIYKRFPNPDDGFEPLVFYNLTLDELTGELMEALGSEVVLGATELDVLQGVPVSDPITLDFDFVPSDPTRFPILETLPDALKLPDGVTAEMAAVAVHSTTRASCLRCHASAAGGNGSKRGDMSTAFLTPSVEVDYHMSPDGQDMSCADCHDAGGHRLKGRGLDLRPNDVPGLFTCDNSGCHSAQPHGDFSTTQGSSWDKHAMKVACQTCHIPTYAKGVKTETARDWTNPHLSQHSCGGRGGWLGHEYKAGEGALPEETLDPSNPDYTQALIPNYAWFDGTSEVYFLGEPLDGLPTVPLTDEVAAAFEMTPGAPAYVMGKANGDVTGGIETKIYPMKEHWGKLGRLSDPDTGTQTLVAHSTFEFFRTGSFCRAVAVGLGLINIDTPPSADEAYCGVAEPGDLGMPPGVDVVPVHTYQTLNHGVEPEDNALTCRDCHVMQSDGLPRMDLKGGLGYGMRTGTSAVVDTLVTGSLDGDLDRICSQCHENETQDRDFSVVHRLHVREKRKDCAACHDFTRPERDLSLTRDD